MHKSIYYFLAVACRNKSSQKDAYRIVLRNKIPPSQEQRNLKKHDVNEIILVENYENFYTDFLLAYQEYQTENKEKIYKHINPEIIIKTEKKRIFRVGFKCKYI